MTQEHPITPPPELVNEWALSLYGYDEAARWGADQELEAILALAKDPSALDEDDEDCYFDGFTVAGIREARRPNPPSLKEQALQALDDASDRLDAAHENIIRRALEQLND